MKALIIVAALLSVGSSIHGKEWKPTDDFLRAVRAVESSNGQFRYGDSGQSLGDYQLSEAAWLDVNEWRRSRGLKTYQYDTSVFNGFINRVYASNYFAILYGELQRKLNRAPNHAELYAAYNMGLTTFGECDYQLHKVNAKTREKCRQIVELVGDKSL